MKNKKMIVALVATAAIAMSLVSTAFAAPATTTCPKAQALQQLLGDKGITLPTTLPTATGTTNCPKAQALQQLLKDKGITLPATLPTTPAKKPCPKTQPTTGTTAPAPTATPAPTTAPSTGSTAPVSGNMSTDESKMINLVNQDRADNGLKPLTFDAGLRSAALLHSQDMSNNNYFSHTSPSLGDFGTRLKASGVKYSSAGENIALYGSVDQAEVGFMNSPGHRANILGDYTRVGIGIVFNQTKGMYYITQWFAK